MPVTVITGCSTGIGRAAALTLARGGHDVFATMRDLARGDSLRAEAASLKIQLVELDVTDAASVERAISTVLGDAGHIDNFVSNAGINESACIEDTEVEVFERVMATNFFGAMRCVRAVLPHMRERGSGCIAAVTSQSGRIAQPTQGAYAASKYALEAAFEVLALEVAGFGLRVAIVEPGMTKTPMLGKGTPWPDTVNATTYRRMGAVFARDAVDASTPELIATEIERALRGDDRKLRYPVGVDAARNLAGRARLSDEDWVALAAAANDDAFYDAWTKHFGVDPRSFAG